MSEIEILQNVPLNNKTTWKVGGCAEYFFEPQNIDQLQTFFARIPADQPIFWLGLGSNILVREGGISGYVISTLKGLNQIEIQSSCRVRAQAGVSCAKFARFAARLGWVGAEFLAGIPGTIGGALAMNAGCWGGETWNWVEKVYTIDRQGQIHIRSPEEFQIGYREVEGRPNEWFVAADFFLNEGDKDLSLAKIRTLLDQRSASQPTGEPSCGSVFRNPPGNYAAKLIEASFLKGKQLGGAQVSTKHANFIVNTGNATAWDIEQLIMHVSEEVKKLQNVQLITEVKMVGTY